MGVELTDWMVTRLAWMAQRLVSSKRETRYDSTDSCRAPMAEDWKRRSDLKSWAISRTCWGDASVLLWVKQARRDGAVGKRTRVHDAYQALEGELADEELSRLLVATDLTESDGTRLVAVRLLDTSGGGRALAGSLGGKLLTRGLATGGLASSLLSAGHYDG
jgi:hypothetical protein